MDNVIYLSDHASGERQKRWQNMPYFDVNHKLLLQEAAAETAAFTEEQKLRRFIEMGIIEADGKRLTEPYRTEPAEQPTTPNEKLQAG